MEQVRNIVLQTLSCPQESFFDEFTRKFDDHYDTLTSGTVRRDDKERQKGLAFEELCYQMIQVNAFPMLKSRNVWRFTDFPYRKEFDMGTTDQGIDLVVENNKGEFLA